ncbi:2-hydroxyacid dehydrogenase [Quadrisphaera sp. DSM 44207]|uniref:2-hydroxyacid dehydrogenase n=1 Tax=Quadrisphaera sp. DSM 44207 TaxID=1881057 RepID=UPI0008877F5E|nr:2-hydroxyacid dehydrogenase [Quadrisphaera sp. DSM 44207]SDQ34211.1 D-lactate dehydrogenase [Quadrisphaera sp. DSM 44207]
MGRAHVVVLSKQGSASLDAAQRRDLAEAADVDYHRLQAAPDRAAAVRLLQGADVLAATNACLPVLDAALLDALPRLRGVVLYATGYDHIDTALLRARGVALSVLPDYATQAVAEHGVAMLLGLATRLHLAHDRSRGLVPPQTSLRGVQLCGRRLGVVGLGRIGSAVAAMGAGLGMRVSGVDPAPAAAAAARAAGARVLDLPHLLAASDAVVVCANHVHGAPPVLGAAELALLPDGALLANVSRASLVDTAAAVDAVRSGRLRGYAVDDTVLDPVEHADLLREGRVLQTGHSAWWRDEVLVRGRRLWGAAVLAAVTGRPTDAVVPWRGDLHGDLHGDLVDSSP